MSYKIHGIFILSEQLSGSETTSFPWTGLVILSANTLIVYSSPGLLARDVLIVTRYVHADSENYI